MKNWSDLFLGILLAYSFAWLLYEVLGTRKVNRELEEMERDYQRSRRDHE